MNLKCPCLSCYQMSCVGDPQENAIIVPAGQFIRKYFTALSYAVKTHAQGANYSAVFSLSLP